MVVGRNEGDGREKEVRERVPEKVNGWEEGKLMEDDVRESKAIERRNRRINEAASRRNKVH